MLLRNNLNKAKAGMPKFSSDTLSSGAPSLAALYLLVHPSFMYSMSLSLVYTTQMPSGAPLSPRNSFCHSASNS